MVLKRIVVFVIVLFSALMTYSQSCHVQLPECARPDTNVLQMFGEGREFERFVEKMDSVVLFGQGRVNILHIGGSHVQADFYTHVIRQNIDSLNADLRPPRGYVFPYSAAKTNNPLNYRSTYGGEWKSARNARKQFDIDQGMGGILIYTSDSSSWINIDLNRDSTLRYQTNRVHLLGRSMHGAFSPRLMTKDSLFFFPTIEPTGYLFNLDKDVEEFKIEIIKDTALSHVADTFVITGIMPDNDEPGIVYNSIGVNGASVPSYLDCKDFERDLHLMKPDLAIFAIGINDATAGNFTDSLFCANYDSLISRIRNVNPDCALLFITNNDSYKRKYRRTYIVNTNGLVAQESFYKLARKYNGGLYDLFKIMGGLKSMAQWQEMGLARRDKVHFTQDGYEIIGKMFFDAFLEYYLNTDYKLQNDIW